jgi:uncharacterized protein with von Willebrand factor type A (vWA) domain
MYPFGGLPENLVAFGRVLRHEHGFGVGAGELRDAAHALEVVDLSDERAVRNALRPIVSSTANEASLFDSAFTAFFFPESSAGRQLTRPLTRSEGNNLTSGRTDSKHANTSDRPDADHEGAALSRQQTFLAPLAMPETTDAAPALFARASYSPLETDGLGAAPELAPVPPVWRDSACAFVRRLRVRLSRSWRAAPRGRRFDLRRTWRVSLQTGGEPLTPRWLRRVRRAPNVVLLIDGSRSMSAYAHTGLKIAVAMATATRRLEVFTFSTALERITNDVRLAAAGEARRLEYLHHAWAGGTSIGGCLRHFLQRLGERLIGRGTVVVIVSDGLDIGQPEMLGDAMRELYRRSAGVVWLNPLLDTPGYEPTAAGMRAALPYITTFANVTDANALIRLSRLIRVRS